jgi:hypothetical protein
MIPATTGAASAVGKVIPELLGKLTGVAVRVPTVNVSLVDLVVSLARPASYEELCAEIRRASENEMRGYFDIRMSPSFRRTSSAAPSAAYSTRRRAFRSTKGLPSFSLGTIRVGLYEHGLEANQIHIRQGQRLLKERKNLDYIISLVAGYLLGSISVGILLGRSQFKADVRSRGSGNAGATNVARVFGLGAGLATFLGDAAKTFAALFIGSLLAGRRASPLPPSAALPGTAGRSTSASRAERASPSARRRACGSIGDYF